MSEYVFKLPDLGEGTVESEIGEWFINVGDKVKEEDVVGTMMTDKAAIEVSSPVSGTVIELGGKPGDIIAVGAPLVTFETENDVAAATAPAAEAAPEAVAESPARRRITWANFIFGLVGWFVRSLSLRCSFRFMGCQEFLAGAWNS